MKEVILVGGPNGAGKTTFIESFLDTEKFTYLGADLIAYELCPTDVASVALAAGREFIKRIAVHRDKGDSVIIESTLSGRSLAGHIKKFREQSYLVRVVFFTIPNANVSAERVRIRVNKGGHDVPIEDIKRRYLKTHQNFWNLYRGLGDRWFLYDNQKQEHGLIALGEKDQYSVKDKPAMKAFLWKLKN